MPTTKKTTAKRVTAKKGAKKTAGPARKAAVPGRQSGRGGAIDLKPGQAVKLRVGSRATVGRGEYVLAKQGKAYILVPTGATRPSASKAASKKGARKSAAKKAPRSGRHVGTRTPETSSEYFDYVEDSGSASSDGWPT